MLSSHFQSKHSDNLKFFLPLFLFLLIKSSNEFVAAADGGQLLNSPESDAPTHLSFFRSALRGRQRVLSCANDVRVCLDREKNPWGGTTCCFQQWCRDTLRDSNNCGGCGKKCGFGFVCCGGMCVDVRNDSRHCGSCFEECPGQGSCSFAMCDYAG